MDIVDRTVRSRMMAAVRTRNTRPEVLVRRLLHSQGYRFRLHVKDLPGKPDIVLRKHRMAIFVHGCFWHRHEGCRYTTSPATNEAFWQEKFEGNVRRDREAIAALHTLGWRTVIVWECVSRETSAHDELAERLGEIVKGDADEAELSLRDGRPVVTTKRRRRSHPRRSARRAAAGSRAGT